MEHLISKRNRKAWEADKLSAVNIEIGTLVANPYMLSWKQKHKLVELTKLRERLEDGMK